MKKAGRKGGPVVVEYDASRIPAQSAFHSALETRRFGIFLGGRQGGKTTAGAHQCWREIARGLEPKLGWIIAPTYAMAEIAERDFLAVCPSAVVRKREYGDRRVYDIANGYRVEIRTGDDPDTLRGSRLAWYWADEIALLKKAVVDVLYPNLLSYRGKMWGTTTPRGKGWLYDQFYLKTIPGHLDYDPEYFCIRSKTSDNVFLDSRDVSRLATKYSGAFRAQEIEAEFVNFEGMVYRDFDQRLHVVPDMDPEDKRIGRVVAGIDFGFKDPFVYLWIAEKEGQWIVVDEHYECERETTYHARMIRSNPWERRVQLRFADPRGKQSRMDLQRYGVTNFAAHKHEIYDGILEISRLLVQRTSDGKPLLQVCRRCRNVIREFGEYRFRETEAGKNVTDKPAPWSDHCMDALRYALYSVNSSLYHGEQEPATPAPPGPGTYGYILENTGYISGGARHSFLSRARTKPGSQGCIQSIFNA